MMNARPYAAPHTNAGGCPCRTPMSRVGRTDRGSGGKGGRYTASTCLRTAPGSSSSVAHAERNASGQRSSSLTTQPYAEAYGRAERG